MVSDEGLVWDVEISGDLIMLTLGHGLIELSVVEAEHLGIDLVQQARRLARRIDNDIDGDGRGSGEGISARYLRGSSPRISTNLPAQRNTAEDEHGA